MRNAVYVQATGLLTLPDGQSFSGYSGRWNGRNNPDMAATRDVGPLPCGFYTIGLPMTHPRLGPLAFRLIPDGNAPMFGRGGFYIHGDNAAHDASHGCIVMSHEARVALQQSGCRTLVVRAFPARPVQQEVAA